MGVIESATRLFDLLSARDDTFTKYLTIGLSEAEITRIMAPVGIQLPAEAAEFYRHFNLPGAYAYQADQPHFYGIHWLLGLEDAVEELLTSRRELWAEFCPVESYPGRPGWFPLLQEDANLYVLDTANTVDGRCPVLEFSEYDDPKPVFASLEAMFETLYRWVQEDVLGVKHGGVVGYYHGDPRRVVAIANELNPGLDVWNAWLEYKLHPPGYLR